MGSTPIASTGDYMASSMTKMTLERIAEKMRQESLEKKEDVTTQEVEVLNTSEQKIESLEENPDISVIETVEENKSQKSKKQKKKLPEKKSGENISDPTKKKLTEKRSK